MNLLDWFFPKTCVGCGKIGAYFCPVCLKTLGTSNLICPVCEKAQPFGETHIRCLTGYSLDGFVYVYNYEKLIKEAIHRLKYCFVSSIAEELVDLTIKQIREKKDRYLMLEKFIVERKPTVIPVPLYWRRKNYRGFNQAELIGKTIAKHYNLPFSDQVLVRVKQNVSQTELTMKERKKNVDGIFSVHTSHLPSSLLLIDDVWTTGATMGEACRVLKVAGAKKVWGITIAR